MELQTKTDFRRAAQEFLEPLKPLYSPRGARLRLGGAGATYDRDAIELEGFSRVLWALGPFWMGGGRDAALEAVYTRGLAAGTDPQSPEYWGEPGPYDQRLVEMAAIACAMLEAPERVWDPLSDRAKDQLAAWLFTINRKQVPECNWQFFVVLVNLALDSVGMPSDSIRMEDALQKIDRYYVGEGWYSDGRVEKHIQRDYYVPWAFHYYGLLYSVFAAKRDPVRAARFRERAVCFGRQFIGWFDPNGAALPFGRSLTYRFAQVAFWSACVFAGAEPVPTEVMKGLIVRNLRWWMEKPIRDRDGVLTVGYCYPQLYMAERYNAPGSPYWGMKAFLVLALPDDDPFWTAEAAPLPSLKPLMSMPEGCMLVQRLKDGQVNAYPAGNNQVYGHGQFAEKYAKFVYNTRFGFSVSHSCVVLHQAAPDSMLAFVIDGYVFVRQASDEYQVLPDRVISVWTPFEGIRVETTVRPCMGGHIRKHVVTSRYDCEAYDCGFAVPKYADNFSYSEVSGEAIAQSGSLFCSVTGNGEGKVIMADPNTNLYSPNTVIPSVRYNLRKGKTVLITRVLSKIKD